MSIVVEDGTGLADANAYCGEDTFDNYTDERGYVITPGDTEAALIRATQCLDAIYRKRWPGTRTNGRAQGLDWPRQDATDAEQLTIANDEIPIEVIEVTCELAMRELAAPNSILPDLERGGGIRSLRAGSVAIEYNNQASAITTLQIIDGILSTLIGGSARNSSTQGTVARG